MTDFWQTIPHSMFDFAAYYDEVAEQLPHHCIIAEVGIADGASSLYLAEKLQSIKKDFTLIMIDNLDYGKENQLNEIIRNVQKSGLSEYINILPIDSLNASLKFNDGALDFVFLDSGHTFELTKAEIRLWMRKVKDGGILAGHDYLSEENPGVREAVNEVLHGYPNLHFPETEKGYGVWEIKKEHQEIPL